MLDLFSFHYRYLPHQHQHITVIKFFFSRCAGLRIKVAEKMLLQCPSFVTVTTLSLLGIASASVVGHARPHHHLRRSTIAVRDETPGAANVPRSNSGSIDVPLAELHLLQSETTAFQIWMGAWLDLENSTDPVSAIALLRQEVQAYEGWINAWLDSALSVGGPAPPPLPSSIPLTLPTKPANSSLVLSSAPLRATSTSSSIPAVVASSTAIASSAKPSLPGGEFFQVEPSTSQSSVGNATNIVPSPTSFITLATQIPAGPFTSTPVILSSVTVSATPVSSSSQVASAHAGPSASQAAPSPGGSPSGSGQFNAQSSNNVAVYYGQTAATGQTSLGTLCQNENVDIVVLAFLTEFFGPGGFPSLNFGPACGGQTPQMQSAGASKLLSCPEMASQITQCQGLGKKVLLSLGGSEAVSALPSDSKATDFANQLWNLFGAGTGLDPGLRPFGDVKLDGFDVGELPALGYQPRSFLTNMF